MDILTINDRPGQYPASWYAATAEAPGPFPPAEGEIRAEVCVVGGGFSGLSAALWPVDSLFGVLSTAFV